MSFAWLTAGSLSAKNSIPESNTNTPITHQFSNVSHGEVRLIKFVNLLNNATTRSGIYAFNPALADNPKAVNISIINSPYPYIRKKTKKILLIKEYSIPTSCYYKTN